MISSEPRRREWFTRALRSIAPALALPLFAACASEISLDDFDRVARGTGMQTVVLAEDLSLFSPYDPFTTNQYLREIRKERDEVFALFELRNTKPLLVWLQPDAGIEVDATLEDGQFAVRSVSVQARAPFLGLASGVTVRIQVAPPNVLTQADGSPLIVSLGPSMFTGTIRHELTHVAAHLLGVPDADWCNEGIAHAVEWFRVEHGRFVVDPVPERLRGAADLPRELRSIEALLAWRQGPEPTDADRQARTLAASLVVFVSTRTGASTFREGILRLVALHDAELRALQADWSTWLDGFASPRSSNE